MVEQLAAHRGTWLPPAAAEHRGRGQWVARCLIGTRPGGQVGWTAYFLASRIRLNGVSVARRNRVKPASANTRASRASPAWAPSARPTSCEREFGVQTMVDAA